jgi:predicted RNA methylase
VSAMVAAVEAAVRHIQRERDCDCRVLLLGAGAGLLALAALRAGARYVTCVERWLYQAQTCKQVLAANGVSEQRYVWLAGTPLLSPVLKCVAVL